MAKEKTVRKKMVELREAAGVSRAVMAEKLGVSEATVYALETGRRSPSAGLFRAIETAYGAPVGVLFPDLFGETV